MLAHRKNRSTEAQQQQQEQQQQAEDDQQQYYMADELTWPTRLTIILIGASVLFSLFFGLEFIVAKLVSSLSSSSSTSLHLERPIPIGQLQAPVLGAIAAEPWPSAPAQPQQQQQEQLDEKTGEPSCKIRVELPFQWVRDVLGSGQNLSLVRLRPDSDSRQQPGRKRSKLGVNFELIYESELRLNEAQTHYQLEQDHHHQEQPEVLLVKPELKLHQLLAAYHVAMPFNPDIWTLSEPQQQARELLSGHLFECETQLSGLVKSIERVLTMASPTTSASNLSTTGSGEPHRPRKPQRPPPPLARVGHSHYKLMKLLDASGRPEAGLLMGHPFWLGSYLECQHLNSMGKQQLETMASGQQQPLEQLETRYCVGKLAFKSWLQPGDHEPNNGQPQQQQQSIKVGLCLPRQCDSLELFKHQDPNSNASQRQRLAAIESVRALSERLIRFNLNEQIYPASHLKLVDIYCLPTAERRQLGAVAYLLLLFILGWLSLLIVCTVLRSQRQHRQLVDPSDGAIAKQGTLEALLGDKLIDSLAIGVNFSMFLGAKQQSNFLTTPSHQKQKRSHQSQAEPIDTISACNRPPPIVNLNVLDSIKHLGCAGVILAHVLLTYLTLGTSYNHTIETMGRDLRTMLLLSLNNIVDTFFVISGLLVAYLTFKKMNETARARQRQGKEQPEAIKQQQAKEQTSTSMPGRWLGRYLRVVASRYMRMAPLYFLVYAFAKTISVHLGEGPLWDYATNADSLRGLCKRESWLWPLTFASDLKPISQHCVPPAWSISVDMQFFLVAPLFVRLLMFASSNWHKLESDKRRHRRQLASYVVLGSLLLLSTALTLADYKSLLDFVSLRDFAKLRLHVFTVLIRHAAHAYSQPQNRMGPILIGLVGGHLLFEYEERLKRARAAESRRKIRNAKGDHQDDDHQIGWPFWMRGRYFKLTMGACVLFVVAPCLVQLRERARLWDARMANQSTGGPSSLFKLAVKLLIGFKTSTMFDCYLALSGFVLIKLLWSIGNCIIFLRLITDLNQTIWARLMSLQFWQILSRLNYAILLVHFEVIAYEAMSRLTHDGPISWCQLMTKFSFAYLGSLVIACPLYVLFEQPIHQLISGGGWLMGGSNNKNGADK